MMDGVLVVVGLYVFWAEQGWIIVAQKKNLKIMVMKLILLKKEKNESI